jgi:hypothetical protein
MNLFIDYHNKELKPLKWRAIIIIIFLNGLEYVIR